MFIMESHNWFSIFQFTTSFFSLKYVSLHGKTDTNAFPLNGVERRFETDNKRLTQAF